MNQDQDKLMAIARLVEDVRLARAAGKQADEEAIVAAHPELMPELGEELEKVRRVWSARAKAEVSSGESIDQSGDPTVAAAQGLAAEFERPAMQVPGYSILKEVNRGGQAVVYLATQLSTGRKVALKVMRDGPLADERALARFKREVQILAALNHPNIVTILDTGMTLDGSRYLAMSYIAGHSLDEYMKYWHKKDPSDPGKLLRLFLKICGAMNAAHVRGVVHRDLKPSNIRIDERGEPHILDFGLARAGLDQLISGERPVSITGEFLGSLPWSSPEQAEGDPEKIDTRTDVYSLGVILYQMLAGGRFPYEVVGNIRDVLNNILTVEPTPPSKVIAGIRSTEAQERRLASKDRPPIVNREIEKIVLKALAKKREGRYQSAGDLGRDVANYLSGQPMAVRPIRSNRSRRTSKSVAVVLLAGLLIGGIVYGRRFFVQHQAPASNAALSSSSQNPEEIPPTNRHVDMPILGNAPRGVPSSQASDPANPGESGPPVSSEPQIPADAAKYDNHHFKLFVEELGWNGAAERCREMGGHLACLETGDEKDFVQKLKGPEMTAWVGGQADGAGVWTWTDGKAIEPDSTREEAGKADFHWLFLSTGGKLLARPESGKVEGAAIPMVQGFICEWDQ